MRVVPGVNGGGAADDREGGSVVLDVRVPRGGPVLNPGVVGGDYAGSGVASRRGDEQQPKLVAHHEAARFQAPVEGDLRHPALKHRDRGLWLFQCGRRDGRLGSVGDLALLLAPQGLDLVGVGLPGCGGRLVGIGGVRAAGVRLQGGQLRLALGAQNLVPGHGTGVLGGGGPAQRHPAVLGGLGGQSAGGQDLGRGFLLRLRGGFGRVLGVVLGQVDAGEVVHLALLAVPQRPDPIGVAHPRLVGASSV